MVIRSAICWENETRKENAKGAGKEEEMRDDERDWKAKGMKIHSQHWFSNTEQTDGKSWLPIASRRVDSERIQLRYRRLMNARGLRYWHKRCTCATVAGGNSRETSRGERSKVFAKFSATPRRRFDHRFVIVAKLTMANRRFGNTSYLSRRATDIPVLGFWRARVDMVHNLSRIYHENTSTCVSAYSAQWVIKA